MPMPFFVYGRDSKTGEPIKRIYSEAETEEAARAQAATQGMLADTVVACAPNQASPLAVPLATAGSKNVGPLRVDRSTISKAQREVIDGVARLMRIVAIALITIGILQLIVAALGRNFSLALQSVAALITAVLTLRAATRFRLLAQSSDNESNLLTEALESLRSLYLYQAVLTGLAILVVVAVIFMLIVKVGFKL